MFRCNHGDANCKDIDNELLIEEVKNRPALYNRSMKEYNDLHYKRTLWEEINEKVYHDVWNQMSNAQKEVKGAELVKRWNNLRTCFKRELKIISDPLQNKRKKYIYFNQLLFLLDERPDLITVNILDQEPDTEVNTTNKRNPEKKLNTNTKERDKDFEKYVHNSISKLREEIAMKECSKDSVESMPKTFSTDADTNFSLSLVPMLKMIPIDKKIDAQIEILSILKKYTSSSSRIAHEYGAKFEKEDEQIETDNISEASYYIEDN